MNIVKGFFTYQSLKRAVVLLILLIVTPGCFRASSPPALTLERQEDEPEPEALPPPWVQHTTSDTIHSGKGIVSYKDRDPGEAYEAAKEKAREDLTKTIEVRVEAITELITRSTLKGASEEVEEEFRNIIRTYVDIGLKDVNMEDWRDEKRMEWWALATLDKEKYDAEVREDLRKKKERILSYYKEGKRFLSQDDFTNGLGSLFRSLALLYQLFGGIAVRDTTLEEEEVELHSYLEGRIKSMIGSLHLSPVKNNLIYNIQGHVEEEPMVSLVSVVQGRRVPARNFPLKVSFVQGQGVLQEAAQTGQDGIARISIRRIDPKYSEAGIRISPELEPFARDFGGLPVDFRVPETRVNLIKRKSVALSLIFYNAGHRMVSSSLVSNIKRILVEKGLNVVERDLQEEIRDEIMIELSDKGIDFILSIIIHAEASEIEEGLYAARTRGTISFYSTQERTLSAQYDIPSQRGFGITAEGSGWEALKKTEGAILSKIREMDL